MADNTFYPYPGYIEVVGFNSMGSQIENLAEKMIDANNTIDGVQNNNIATNTALINAEVERSKSADAVFESDLAE